MTMTQVRDAMGVPRIGSPRLKASLLAMEQLKEVLPFEYKISDEEKFLALSPLEKDARLRTYWEENIIPKDIELRPLGNQIYVTRRNKRILVLTSIAHEPRVWRFVVPNKSVEVIVFLCWDGLQSKIFDFVVPQSAYRERWKLIDKKLKSVGFLLVKNGSVYQLQMPVSAPPIDVTQVRGDYTSLR
jgi:hypothetical protein